MPIRDVATMVRVADRLEAVERLQSIQDAAIASGYAKKPAVNAHLRYLKDKAAEGRPESSGAGTSLRDLRLAGVSVVKRPGGKPRG